MRKTFITCCIDCRSLPLFTSYVSNEDLFLRHVSERNSPDWNTLHRRNHPRRTPKHHPRNARNPNRLFKDFSSPPPSTTYHHLLAAPLVDILGNFRHADAEPQVLRAIVSPYASEDAAPCRGRSVAEQTEAFGLREASDGGDDDGVSYD